MKDSLAFKVLVGIVLALLALFLVAKARNEFAARDYIGKAVQDRDTITIGGTGKVTSKPDLAKVDIGLYSDATTVASVQADNTQKMNAIIAALKGLGVKDEDIQTSNYNLQPKIDWSTGRQIVRGYTLSQQVNVKVRDLGKVGDVLETSVSQGANQIYGVQFTIDDPSSLEDEARIEAIQDAKEKAEALAEATGLHIVKVVSFSESNGYVPPMRLGVGLERAMDSAQNAAPQIEAGSLDVTTNVTVTFEVR